jgi:hypothetical protein
MRSRLIAVVSTTVTPTTPNAVAAELIVKNAHDFYSVVFGNEYSLPATYGL